MLGDLHRQRNIRAIWLCTIAPRAVSASSWPPCICHACRAYRLEPESGSLQAYQFRTIQMASTCRRALHTGRILAETKKRKQLTIPQAPVLSMKLWFKMLFTGSAFAASNPKDKIYGVWVQFRTLGPRFYLRKRYENSTSLIPRHWMQPPPILHFPSADSEGHGHNVLGNRPSPGHAPPLSRRAPHRRPRTASQHDNDRQPTRHSGHRTWDGGRC